MPLAEIVVPTDAMHHHAREQHENFYHLLPRLRQGTISGEVFARAKREQIPVDPDVQEGGRKAASASEIKKATEMGVRGKRRSVGKKAPLQQTEKKRSKEKGREEAVASAKQRKVTKRERRYGQKRG